MRWGLLSDALMGDYVHATPEGHAGGAEDDSFNRMLYWMIRSSSSSTLSKGDPKYFESEMGVHITMTWYVFDQGV